VSFKKGEYEDAANLQALTLLMVRTLPQLKDAESAKWKVMYSLNELDHIGGKCKRVTGTEKFHTGLDFDILIHKPPFIASGALERLRILAHELYHIEKSKAYFKVRIHEGDFCEIADHDKFSYTMAEQAAIQLGISI